MAKEIRIVATTEEATIISVVASQECPRRCRGFVRNTILTYSAMRRHVPD